MKWLKQNIQGVMARVLVKSDDVLEEEKEVSKPPVDLEEMFARVETRI